MSAGGFFEERGLPVSISFKLSGIAIILDHISKSFAHIHIFSNLNLPQPRSANCFCAYYILCVGIYLSLIGERDRDQACVCNDDVDHSYLLLC